MTDRFVTVPDSLELPAAVKVGVDRLHDSTAAGRALLTGADAAAQRSSLGLGTAAVADAADFEAAGTTAAAFDVVAVDQITLTAPLALTVPAGFPAGQVYRVTLTQDGTGGHTVTYDGHPVTVDLTSGAVTTVELHPAGTGYVVRYPGVADLASLSSTYVATAVMRGVGIDPTGATDSTTAIRAKIAAAAALGVKHIHFPDGTYLIDAAGADDGFGYGLQVTEDGTEITLDPGAVLQVIPNAASGYQLIRVLANDCRIAGGTLRGDVQTHTGATGEWGHLIAVTGNRCEVSGVTVREAWGDGIAVMSGAEDAHLANVIADSNRRQGVSLIGAIRPRITGGVFRNTGQIAFHSPGAGIDIEPNPLSGYDVSDFLIRGAVCTGNKGAGLQIVRAEGQTTSGVVDGLVCSDNDTHGVWIFQSSASGSALRVSASNMVVTGNASTGLYVTTDGLTAKGIVASRNGLQGVVLSGPATLSDLVAAGNGRSGVELSAGSSGSTISSATATGNSQSAGGTYDEVIVWDTCTLSGVITATPASGNRAKHGLSIRSSSVGTVLRNCLATGNVTNILYNAAGVRTVATPHPARKILQGTAAPTSGVYLVGDRVEHSAPAPGGSLGWVCTTAGGNGSAAWAATTAYVVGAWITEGNRVYECVTAGTSGSTAPTPPGLGATVVDGTVTWLHRQTGVAAWKAYGAISP